MFVLAVDNLPRLLLEAFEDLFQFALGVLVEVSGVLNTLQCEPCHSCAHHCHFSVQKSKMVERGKELVTVGVVIVKSSLEVNFCFQSAH